MPIVKTRKGNKERFRCEGDETKLIEEAEENYRNSGHDVYDFVLDFFGVRSSNPSSYLKGVKRGGIMTSTGTWKKLNDYLSKMRSK